MYVILIQERNGKRLKMMKNITKRHKNNESSKRLKKMILGVLFAILSENTNKLFLKFMVLNCLFTNKKADL